jgi:hypothetical protein
VSFEAIKWSEDPVLDAAPLQPIAGPPREEVSDNPGDSLVRLRSRIAAALKMDSSL